MSQLKDRLTSEMKDAMRARQSLRLNTIRFLLAAIKNFEIDNGEQDDAGVVKIIAKEVKKIQDALVDFRQANRQDLVTDEEAKLAVMNEYLPQQLSDQELADLVSSTVTKLEDRNFALAMKAAIAAVGGRADGGRVAAAVKSALGAG